jgi:anaerobic magnesium-protoporphyrin IX monomethyl ester cyclase
MIAEERPSPKVLVITGGLLNEKESSAWRALKKQWSQWLAAESAWLDLKIKLNFAEFMVLGAMERRLAGNRLSPQAQAYFSRRQNMDTPELTEVLLTTLLRQEGLGYEVAAVDDVFASTDAFKEKLASCTMVFLSATLLRDLSEVEPLVRRLKQQHNRIVVGGALAGLLADTWTGMADVDVLAVGYGEMLVPILARYILSDYRCLEAVPPAVVQKRGDGWMLRSGVPSSSSLDGLPTPDWAATARERGAHYPMVYYESVRGCPYRCSFCNYPFLFDDTKFRYKSAKKIADDWQRYKEEGNVEYITCLDSLFTMPRRRLIELCEELVTRKLGLKWICYARADDLASREIVQMMQEAGAHQVQIGLESGDASILANMDKQCTVESNSSALRNCRDLGLTTVTSLIVGFPGETAATLETSYRFLEETPPDFYFLAVFSTRATGVPVLNEVNRRRFQLVSDANPRTVAPYWRHLSMNAVEASQATRNLHSRLMRNRISLNAALFYSGMLQFDPAQREALLDFQADCVNRHPVVQGAVNLAHRWLDRRLERNFQVWNRSAPLPPHLPPAVPVNLLRP